MTLIKNIKRSHRAMRMNLTNRIFFFLSFYPFLDCSKAKMHYWKLNKPVLSAHFSCFPFPNLHLSMHTYKENVLIDKGTLPTGGNLVILHLCGLYTLIENPPGASYSARCWHYTIRTRTNSHKAHNIF